jgi:hypothetical protein
MKRCLISGKTVKVNLTAYLEGKISVQEIITECLREKAKLEFIDPNAFRERKNHPDASKLFELVMLCQEKQIDIINLGQTNEFIGQKQNNEKTAAYIPETIANLPGNVLDVDLIEYLKGSIKISDIVKQAKVNKNTIIIKNPGLLSIADKKTLGGIFSLIYEFNANEIDVYIPVTFEENGKQMQKYKKFESWTQPGLKDVLAEIEAEELFEDKTTVEYLLELCHKANATILRVNNTPEKMNDKNIMIYYNFSNELQKNGITLYDPLEKGRAIESRKNPKNNMLPNKENLIDYKSGDINRFSN